MDKQKIKKRIAVAAGRKQADLVIKNGRIIDVFNGEIIKGDIAIVDGNIVGIGQYTGEEIVDAMGRYVCPAFIDGHVHVESSMVMPQQFAKMLLPHGVTSVIADPHEIANVLGTKGIQYMLDSSDHLPFDFFFMLPSSVPATDFEDTGINIEAEDLKAFFTHPRVIGLAEVMNFPSILNGEDSMLDKIVETMNANGKIDGHAAGLKDNELNAYLNAGIKTDHEAISEVEAKARLQRGMYLMIRQGTAAKDLQSLIHVVNKYNSRRCLFVTDDKHLDDLVDEGSIDHNIRLAISSGIEPIMAIQMGTINVAECFGLEDRGAIAPNYIADILFLEDLENLSISHVFKKGKLVVKGGEIQPLPTFSNKSLNEVINITNTVNYEDLTNGDFEITIKGKNRANIIGITPNQLVTKHLIEEITIANSLFIPSIENDQLKLAVVARHKPEKQIGLGIVKGIGIKDGAIASTVSHDSHKLIIAGANDNDMVFAANKLKEIGGGLIVVKKEKVIAELALPLAGLISLDEYKDVYQKLKSLKIALKKIGFNGRYNPFLTLSFLALPVIPALKLTDKGLFDVINFKHIQLESY